MDGLFKRIVLLLGITLSLSADAWTVATMGRVNGPAIHATYFLTPDNRPVKVDAAAYLGIWTNGDCQQSTALYNLNERGPDVLQTGNFVDFDGFKLKAIMGGGYECIKVSYTATQLKQEIFLLVWDGFNYIHSLPQQSEVTIQ
jgi:hypothetical protein